VDIRGLGGDTGTNQTAVVFQILDLYTELYVQAGLSNIDIEAGRIRGEKRISLVEMARSTRCLAIFGDPGSGKTTFLRFLARKSIEEDILPIYLRLSEIYDYAVENSKYLNHNLLIEFVSDLCDNEDIPLEKEFFVEKSADGHCMWLLDSLDELPSVRAREEIVVKVIEKASNKWDKCKFILTSRPLPVQTKSVPLGFKRVGIDHWSQEDIKSFIKVWTQLLYPDATEEAQQRHWANLLSNIMERSDLRSLARNAVMITAMAVVHYNARRLPEGRADLIRALIFWLIRAKERSTSLQESNPRFIEKMYREIALSMLEAKGGRKRRIGKLTAAKQIADNFSGRG